jgi:hypothetical protein
MCFFPRVSHLQFHNLINEQVKDTITIQKKEGLQVSTSPRII